MKPETNVEGRRKAVMMILERLHLDMGLPPLDDRVLLARAVSWEEHLTNMGCKPKDYERVYKLALQNYTNNAPFSIYDLLNAWRQIREVEHASQQVPKWDGRRYNSNVKREELCLLCNGSTMDWHRDENGKKLSLKFIEVNGKSQVATCPECEGTGKKMTMELKEKDSDGK